MSGNLLKDCRQKNVGLVLKQNTSCDIMSAVCLQGRYESHEDI